MRPLLFLVSEEAQYEYGETMVRRTKIPVFDVDGRDSQNSCFGAVLVGIKRALVIFGRKRQLLSARRLIKS
jgi:hypothetical protein